MSRRYVMGTRASAEISVFSNEGFIGKAVFMGGESPRRAIVQNASHANLLQGVRLKSEIDRHGEFLQLMLRHT